MKTRQEIVRECAQAATACWNHYVDESLDQTHQDGLLWVVDETMPQSVSTKEWQAYADEQDRLTREMSDACPGRDQCEDEECSHPENLPCGL